LKEWPKGVPLDPEVVRRLQLVQEQMKTTPFIVFVWGPRPSAGTPESRKRKTIRDDLAQALGEGRVLFSEDADLAPLADAGYYTAEYAEARIADAVVIIPESEGPLIEAAMYSPDLLGKTIVFTTKRVEGGFVETAYGALKVVEVEQHEWERCDRIRRQARAFVETLRAYKFRSQGARFDWEF